jgi:hypothetical protein
MAITLNGTTGIVTADGSVGAPGLKGTDADSGVSFAADSIKFSTGGVERMAISNSGISGISSGLAEADQWRITSTFSSADSILTSNWERVDDRGSAGPLGSGMSQASGIFTFPSPGYWLVTFYAVCAGTHCDWVNALIDATTNGSAYNTVAMGRDSCKDADSYSDVSAQALMDVTSTSDVKMRFQVKAHNALDWYGNTQVSETNVVFLKLGAT